MASDWARLATPDEHGGCSVCGRTDVTLKKDGTLRMHVRADAKGNSHAMSWTSSSPRCSGAGKPPKIRQYGVRKPTGVVFPYGSREEAERDTNGVLVYHEGVRGRPSSEWSDWTEIARREDNTDGE